MVKHELKGIGVISLMKLSAAVGFILGLIYGAIIFLVYLFAGAMVASISNSMGGDGAGGGLMVIVIGLIFAIIAVIASTILCAIYGAVMAIIYNVVAKLVGGVELELDH